MSNQLSKETKERLYNTRRELINEMEPKGKAAEYINETAYLFAEIERLKKDPVTIEAYVDTKDCQAYLETWRARVMQQSIVLTEKALMEAEAARAEAEGLKKELQKVNNEWVKKYAEMKHRLNCWLSECREERDRTKHDLIRAENQIRFLEDKYKASGYYDEMNEWLNEV